MNTNYEENGEKKSFSCKSKASILFILMRGIDCSAHNKKNGDYYEYPSLSYSKGEQ